MSEREMDESEVLLRIYEGARQLLADPKSWTKRSLAMDRAGNHVLPNDTGACQWCALGALDKAYFGAFPDREMDVIKSDDAEDYFQLAARTELRNIIWGRTGGDFGSVARFNDHDDTEHPHILLMLDSAIDKFGKVVQANANV